MKKMIFLRTLVMVATSMLLFTSCQKDPEELLIGKWTITESEDGYINSLGEVEYSEQNNSEVIGATLTFKENGTVDIWGDGEMNTCSWSYAEDIITLNLDGAIIYMEILEMDKETMHTYSKVDEDEDGYGYSDWHLKKIE